MLVNKERRYKLGSVKPETETILAEICTRDMFERAGQIHVYNEALAFYAKRS